MDGYPVLREDIRCCKTCRRPFDLNSLEELTAPWRRTLDCQDFCSDNCRDRYLID